jgi:DNA-binding response OmpR family regulator
MATRILLVDDDPAFRRLCGLALEKEGIEIVSVGSSAEALKVLDGVPDALFDLMLIDMELPGMKGWELVKLLRDRGWETPVVLISVREGVEDKVRGLDLGADDYIVKPCVFGEVVTRLNAVLRRIRRRSTLHVGDLEIDPLLRRVSRSGVEIYLTPREFELLQALVDEKGGVLSKAEIMDRIWSVDSGPKTNALQVHVSRLKRKLRKSRFVSIETVQRTGYRLVEEALPTDRDTNSGSPGAANGSIARARPSTPEPAYRDGMRDRGP